MNNISSFTEEQVGFVSYLKGYSYLNPKYMDRVDSYIHKSFVKEKNVNKSFHDIRRKHRPDITADFLNLFKDPTALKFLTHDFDPGGSVSLPMVIERAKSVIEAYNNKIPGSLFVLLNGFVSGNAWIDFKGENHTFFLESEEMNKWMNQYPYNHPISSNDFRDVIQSFRNTVRLSKPNLPRIIDTIVNNDNNLASLNILESQLDRADFYTNVYWFSNKILKRVFFDIAQRDETAEIKLSYSRDTFDNYRLCSIRITHVGSEALSFEEVYNKLIQGGGEFFNIMSSCQGYCDWTIEADFEGVCKRWRILNFRNMPEIEEVSPTEVKGFTHIFTFYR